MLGLAAVAGSLLALARSAAPDAVRVDPTTGHFVDGTGRVRLFHGVNVVYKKAPWIPPTDRFTTTDSLDLETIAKLREWGFNVVRLGVMWPGVEPALGQVGREYLEKVTEVVRQLGAQGVYTVADLHQDVGSRHFCGEGFPEHYVEALLADPSSRLARAKPFPLPVFEKILVNSSTGMPEMKDCLKNMFSRYYQADQVAALWQELYSPGTELNKGFARYWGTVAETFKSLDSVLAYELLNEPSGTCPSGSCTGGMSDILPELWGSKVETERLAPLYRAAAEAIRKSGAEQPILYEATVFPKMGFSGPFPGPVLNESQQGFAYHIYCLPGDGDNPANAALCKASHGVFHRTYYPFLQKHPSMPGFMTEFGAVGGNPGELAHLDSLLDSADSMFQSWAYWQLKLYQDFTTANAAESLYDSQGNLHVAKLKTLSRTYAQAVAGMPLAMSFDPKTADFRLDFNASLAGVATEIFLNEDLHYEHGFNAAVQPAGCLRREQREKNRLLFTLEESQKPSCQHRVLSLRITALAAPAARAAPAAAALITV